ncbi:hypothetical protein [Nocardia pseudovaccinii]|uniref:hypothetical protein n=1 Tax=Nocardia pseudovaccinii TaxID=189540 RepID=UPI0007A3C6F6|nr:hypothetical protein [Nocardia pseudovaccinii]
MSSSAETTAQRCRHYQRDLGLPAVIMPDTETRIIVQTGPVSAVVMPSRLATEVIAEQQGPLGPVIEHPASRRWAFLTGPSGPCPESLTPALLRWNIGVASNYIVLPSPADERRGFRRWIHEPHNRFRPSMREILEAVLRLRR